MNDQKKSGAAVLLTGMLTLGMILGTVLIGVYPVSAAETATFAVRIEQYYQEGSIPLFQIAFSQLDAEEKAAWIERIYADGQISFLGCAVNELEADSAAVLRCAEKAYADRSTASFSVLAKRMSEKTLKVWLDRALADQQYAFQSVLFGLLDDDRLDALEEEIAGVSARRRALLEERGYSPSDLAPSFLCPDCRDTGYIEGRKCHCFLQAEIRLLYRQSHLEEILKQENFRTFSYEWYEGEDREVMQGNVQEAHLFIDTFDREFRNLLLLGEVGTGKTFLSNCIAKELMDTCHSVVYLTAFELFQLLAKAAFGKDSSRENWEAGYPYLLDCDLLIIDDLGTELPNSFTVSQFFLCINERILRRKSTLISSNLNMEALGSIYSERTLSRIISSYTIRQLPGNDIRIKKRRKLL